jgi:hypothetical protein
MNARHSIRSGQIATANSLHGIPHRLLTVAWITRALMARTIHQFNGSAPLFDASGMVAGSSGEVNEICAAN